MNIFYNKQIFIAVFFIGLNFTINAQTLPPRTPSSFNIKQLHCGHSLTSPLFGPSWPGQYVELVADSTGYEGWQIFGSMIGSAALPGAWLKAHWSQTLNWENKPRDKFYNPNCDPRYDINQWELFVVTENFQGPANFSLNNSEKYLDTFVKNAWQFGNNGNGAPTMLWTNWPALDGTTYFSDFASYGFAQNNFTHTAFRQLLDFLENQGIGNNGGWQRMQTYANTNRPAGSPPIYVIPGNRMMARFYDDMRAGNVPTISSMLQILPDGAHPNHIGAYMVSLIHYACIFGKSPVGLSNQLHPSDPAIDQALASYIQNMIWDVVTSYPLSGITKNSTTIKTLEEKIFSVFPNPSNNYLIIQSTENNYKAEILNSIGQVVLETNQKIIDISSLENGIYYIRVNEKVVNFLKNSSN